MYLERECKSGKYRYLVECPTCKKKRWVTNAKASRCRVCAGKESFMPASKERCDARKRGDGYITKQGYHLIYDGEKYVPAHRLAFPNISKDMVVHHIDGDKINNSIDNLYPCTKSDHRVAHGSLEKISYLIVQSGLITFKNGTYKMSTTMEKFIDANSVNSGEPLACNDEGNPEPSHENGRCNDYPREEYMQVHGSAENPNVSDEGYDIVSSV